MDARDAIWLDVLPSMKGFGEKLAKDGGAEAEKASKGWGKKIGVGLAAGTVAVGAGAALAVKALYSIGETFDDVSDTIRVGTGATGKSLDALVDSAKNIGTKVPAEFDKIGQTVADVNTRLGLTGPTLETLSSQILEVGRIMGEEIDINKLSASFSVFGVKGEDTTKAMDHLYQVSQATGVGINDLAANAAAGAPAMKTLGFSFEETTALAGNLDKAGLNSSKIMAGMGKALVTLAKDGEKPQDAFKRTTSEMSAFLKKGDDAKAIDLASKLFGTRNAPQFVDALKSGAINMADLGKVAGMTEDTILGAGEETMDFAEQWQLFKNNVLVKLEPIATKVFGAFGDGMKWLVDNGLPAMEKFGDAVTAVWDLFVGGDFTTSFSSIFGLEEDDPMVDTLFNIRDTVIEVFDNIKNAVSTAITWVQQFWDEHGAAILAEFQRIFEQVYTTVDSVFTSVRDVVESVFGWLQTFWDEWGDRIIEFFSGMWEHVKGIIDGALQIVRGIWETFAGLFTGDWERMWEGLKDVFEGAWKVVSNAIGYALDALSLVWELAWAGLVSIAGKIWDGLVGAISGPIDRVMQFIQENFIDKINGFFAFLHIPIYIDPIWREKGPALGGGGSRGKQAFSSGGFTGNLPVNEVAGVVHGREFVINANSTARLRRDRPGLLEGLNGYRTGGYVSPALGAKIAASKPGYLVGGPVLPANDSGGNIFLDAFDAIRDALSATIRGTIGGIASLAAAGVEPFGMFGQAAAGAVRTMGAGAADWAVRTLGLEPTLYDQGGLVPPGLTLVSNQTGRPETLLPPGAMGSGPIDLSPKSLRLLAREIADINLSVGVDQMSDALFGVRS